MQGQELLDSNPRTLDLISGYGSHTKRNSPASPNLARDVAIWQSRDHGGRCTGQ